MTSNRDWVKKRAMTQGAKIFREQDPWGFDLGQMLAVFAAIFLIFQPVFQQIDKAGGSKSAAICSLLGGKSALNSQGDGGDGPLPKGGMYTCGHCLACPNMVLGLFMLAVALFLIGPRNQTPARLRRSLLSFGSGFHPTPLQARAPPAL